VKTLNLLAKVIKFFLNIKLKGGGLTPNPPTCVHPWLCVPFKILETLIYARGETIIDPLLLQEQVGFRHGRSAVDQVTLMTQDLEDSFSAKKKAGAVFVDITAAYDTVWHRTLTCKLLRLLPDRHMVHMIMEIVGNRSFTLNTGNGPGYDASRTASRLKSRHPFVPAAQQLISLSDNNNIRAAQ